MCQRSGRNGAKSLKGILEYLVSYARIAIHPA
jgi:hypothetical protein